MQVNIELRNLRGDERADVLASVRDGDVVEIKIRARAVEVDSFGRDTILRCSGASIQVGEADARRHTASLDHGRERHRAPLVEMRLGNASPPRRAPLPGMDPFSMPPPIMPSWAGDIGDTPQRLEDIQRRRRDAAEEAEGSDEGGGPVFRFGHLPHGWGR